MWRRKMQYSELAASPEGRDWELFEAACRIGWAYHGGLIPYEEIVSGFIEASKQNGLADELGIPGIEAIVDCGLSWAEGDPPPELPEENGKVIYLDSWRHRKGKLDFDRSGDFNFKPKKRAK